MKDGLGLLGGRAAEGADPRMVCMAALAYIRRPESAPLPDCCNVRLPAWIDEWINGRKKLTFVEAHRAVLTVVTALAMSMHYSAQAAAEKAGDAPHATGCSAYEAAMCVENRRLFDIAEDIMLHAKT